MGSWRAWFDPARPLRLGVSACLMGEEVRFDGGHKRNAFVVDVLGPFAELIPVCPEAELGLGIPRPPVRQVQAAEGQGEPGSVRLLEERSGRDWTEGMQRLSEQRVAGLAEGGLDGFVLKSNSPSCALERLRVYRANGHVAHREGRGMFADALARRLPNLPLEEEGRLNDPRLREAFAERLFARARWRRLLEGAPGPRDLVAFHTAHKLLLLAHDESTARALGRLVAAEDETAFPERLRAYEEGLHAALAHPASVGRHVNVLQHVLGHFKERLEGDEKAALLESIDDYAAGLVPLAVPVALLRSQVERWGVPWLRQQLYLDPVPKQLLTRARL